MEGRSSGSYASQATKDNPFKKSLAKFMCEVIRNYLSERDPRQFEVVYELLETSNSHELSECINLLEPIVEIYNQSYRRR